MAGERLEGEGTTKFVVVLVIILGFFLNCSNAPQTTPKIVTGVTTASPVAPVPITVLTPTIARSTPLSPATSAPTSTPVVLKICPLCGIPAGEDDHFDLRPFAIKIDNISFARPQSGLSEACIVYEYLTEGGVTRFLAVYHQDSRNFTIGPVRSMRMVDIDLVPQFDAIFGFVGSTQRVAYAFSTSNILDLNQFFNAEAYMRVPWREAPYNVYTSMDSLKEAAVARNWDNPGSFEPYPFSNTPPHDATPVDVITIPFHSVTIAQYRYDSERGTYLRFENGEPQIDANNGQQIDVANVVVQYVRQWETPYLEDTAGGLELDMELIGEGDAEVFRDGVAIPGRWVQKSRTTRTQFLDEDGNLIPFKPGNTWISLVQIGTEVTQEP